MLKVGSAFFACLPFAFMLLCVVIAAEGEPTVIARTTVVRVREEDVFVFVVANPVSTTVSLFARFLVLATQSAGGYCRAWMIVFLWFFVVHHSGI